jgi:hypothetical protein
VSKEKHVFLTAGAKKKLRMKKEIGIENGIVIKKDNEKSTQRNSGRKMLFFRAFGLFRL